MSGAGLRHSWHALTGWKCKHPQLDAGQGRQGFAKDWVRGVLGPGLAADAHRSSVVGHAPPAVVNTTVTAQPNIRTGCRARPSGPHRLHGKERQGRDKRGKRGARGWGWAYATGLQHTVTEGENRCRHSVVASPMAAQGPYSTPGTGQPRALATRGAAMRAMFRWEATPGWPAQLGIHEHAQAKGTHRASSTRPPTIQGQRPDRVCVPCPPQTWAGREDRRCAWVYGCVGAWVNGCVDGCGCV
jgi:hypothetical protein